MASRDFKKHKDYNKKYYNTPEGKASRKKYRSSQKGKEMRRKTHLKCTYGLDAMGYNKLLKEQHGRCAICFELPVSNKRFDIDHNHKSAKVRGLLCHKCNTVLGYCDESIAILESAIKYLKNNANIPYIYTKTGIGSLKREEYYLKKYGMTATDYAGLYKQQYGICAICYNSPKPNRRFDVDHNHITGNVRGLLCNRCNSLLGYADDSILLLQEVIRYLEKWRRY